MASQQHHGPSIRASRRPKVRLVVAVATVVVAATVGCKRKAPSTATPAPGGGDAGAMSCPPPDQLQAAMGEPGRDLRTACLPFQMGRYWLAAVLRMADRDSPAPRLSLLSGGASFKPLLFDIQPAPSEELARLIKQSETVSVRIRPAGTDNRLVRIGVVGRRGGEARPESDEVAVLLQLAAHAPPKLLWTGAGDQVTVDPSGCVVERSVDFQLLFRTRLEMFTTSRARPLPGAKTQCPTGPGMQESVPFKPVPLAAGRPAPGGAAVPRPPP